jgi:seryl-tRNA synthetase
MDEEQGDELIQKIKTVWQYNGKIAGLIANQTEIIEASLSKQKSKINRLQEQVAAMKKKNEISQEFEEIKNVIQLLRHEIGKQDRDSQTIQEMLAFIL